MEFKAYKLSYYLNAQHSMDNRKDKAHTHTFFISLYIEDLSKKGFVNFAEIADIVNCYIDRFSGKYLNEIPPFQELSPTIENMGSIFYENLKTTLCEHEYDLIKLDICENPLRIYSISDRIYLGTKTTDTDEVQ
jgi:6-pyruvoyl tetrahydropterin synthase-like protein